MQPNFSVKVIEINHRLKLRKAAPSYFDIYPSFGNFAMLSLTVLAAKCEISQTFRVWPFFRVKTVKLLNSPGHSLSDIAIRGLRRCSGASFRRKQLEMEIIFRLGTMQPEGLNNVFHFI